MADVKNAASAAKDKGKGFIAEFKEFALKGNVMDMAVGVIIGGAFGNIVTAFTEDFINPLIACIGGTDVAGVIKLGSTGQVLNWGHFVTAIINFLIMAFCIFMMVKAVNKLMSLGKKKEEEKPEEPPKPSNEEVLLTEIRDLLKK
ncbi:MAG: large conductance mechanosensitive channel protein MscL [Oscillospiraceae bacterium]|nr:large conductance mechanosensitive channel protein MscL [Oscillospiraceae bacterium]